MNRLSLIFLFLLVFCSHGITADGVKCTLSAYQYDSTADKNLLLLSDTVSFLTGITSSGFIGPASIEIEVLSVDSVKTNFNLHIVTLGASAETYSRSYSVEYGLPARVDNIHGKNNSVYSYVLTPLEKVDIDTSICNYNHRAKGDFTFRPTAYTDLYYVPSSLGDFYWDIVKGLIETNYRQFMSFANFNLPGKTQVYLYPCPSYSVIWDKRFGMSSDPTRNASYSIYNKSLNTTI